MILEALDVTEPNQYYIGSILGAMTEPNQHFKILGTMTDPNQHFIASTGYHD